MKTEEIIRTNDSDILKSYLVKISKYPVLSAEEEVNIMQKIRNINNIEIVDSKEISGLIVRSLNIGKILVSLFYDENYQSVLDLLISVLKKSQKSYDIDNLRLFKKYKQYVEKLGRNINESELQELFGDSVKDIEPVNNLYQQVQIYIEYFNAYNKMFNSNLKLVVSVAKKYKDNYELIDLINEGNLGLMKAVQEYDFNKGFKFSTYATWWIKSRIQRVAYSQDSLIKIPLNIKIDLMKFNRQVDELEKKFKRKLTKEEIAKQLSMPLKQVEKNLSNNLLFVSLDQPVGEDDTSTLAEFIESDESIDTNMNTKQIKLDVIDILQKMQEDGILKEREATILKMRFGVCEYNGAGMKTLKEVGDEFGLSRERIRAIESKALFKIRKTINSNPQYKHVRNCFK